MKLPLFIANRYLKSKKESHFISFISVISIIGVALGVMVLILALTILNGFEKTIERKISDFNAHINISAFSNKNLPPYKKTIPILKKSLGKNIESISPFIEKNAIIKSKKLTEGLQIKGILPLMDNSKIERYIVEGKYNLEENYDEPKIIIGKKLAEKLQVKLGDRLTLFSIKNDRLPSLANPPGIEQFFVEGIYESGFAAYDDLIAYINFYQAQKLFGIGNQVSGYNIQIKNLSKVDSLTNHLDNILRYPNYVRTFFQLHQHIFTWLDLQKKPIPIILGLITLVAVFNIVGALLMIVLEKTSTIGILKAMGATKKQIIKIFTLQGVYLSLIGIIIGNAAALILSFLQLEFNFISIPSSIYFISAVPISIDITNYFLVSGVAFFLSVLAATIPSYIASRFNPISSIKFN